MYWSGLLSTSVGNSWVYRLAGNISDSENAFKVVSVEGTEQLGGQEYFRVSYFGRTVFLRADAGGSVVSFNRGTGAQEPWVALGTPEGGTFETSIDECANTGTIESRNGTAMTPAGTFQNAIQVRYRGSCVDRGVTQQFYAPDVGLVSHGETGFAGPGEKTFAVAIPLDTLPLGRYKAQASLTTNPVMYLAEVWFEIVAVGQAQGQGVN